MVSNIGIKFVDKEITPFGGLVMFFKMLEKCNFEEVLNPNRSLGFFQDYDYTAYRY